MTNKIINLHSTDNESEKYRVAFEQFIAPFEDLFEEDETINDIYDFSIQVWNIAIMTKLINDDDLIRTVFADIPAENVELSKKMIAYKNENFGTYPLLIKDYYPDMDNNREVLYRLELIDLEAYLNHEEDNLESFDDLEHLLELEDENYLGTSSEEFEEGLINRIAIIITPKQAFVNWVNNLESDKKTIEIDRSSTYLITSKTDSPNKWLLKHFDAIFQQELFGWWTDESDWPQKRNFKLFQQWFTVTLSDFIYDLENEPVSKTF